MIKIKLTPQIIKYALVILLVFVVCLTYFVSQRHPSTTNAYVRATVIPISAGIAGRIADILVKNNAFVARGEKLIQLDPQYFRLQLSIAKNKVALAVDRIKTLKETLSKASNAITVAHERFMKAKNQYARLHALSLKEAVSRVAAENAKHLLLITKAQLSSAKTNRLLLSQSLSENGSATLRLKEANHGLQLAQYALSQTGVYAKHSGIITNLAATVGAQVKVGQILCALIAKNSWWVQANFKETELKYIRPGDIVTITLRSSLKKFLGTVMNISPGIARGSTDASTGLLQTQPENNWVALAQRIPVMIAFNHLGEKQKLVVGSSAVVDIK